MKHLRHFSLNEAVIGHDEYGEAITDKADVSKIELQNLSWNVPSSVRDEMDSRKAWLEAKEKFQAHDANGKGKISKMKTAERREYDAELDNLRERYKLRLLQYKQDLFAHMKQANKKKTENEIEWLRCIELLKRARERHEFSTMTSYEKQISSLKTIVILEKRYGMTLPKFEFHETWSEYLEKIGYTGKFKSETSLEDYVKRFKGRITGIDYGV